MDKQVPRGLFGSRSVAGVRNLSPAFGPINLSFGHAPGVAISAVRYGCLCSCVRFKSISQEMEREIRGRNYRRYKVWPGWLWFRGGNLGGICGLRLKLDRDQALTKHSGAVEPKYAPDHLRLNCAGRWVILICGNGHSVPMGHAYLFNQRNYPKAEPEL